MKKIGSYFLIAILGSSLTLLMNQFLGKKDIQIVEDRIQKDASTHFTNSNVSDYKPVDLSVAATSSVHGVVHVKTSYQNTSTNSYYSPLQELFFGETYSRPQMKPSHASGSGVIISADGFIVTNNHVIQKASKIEIILNSKKTFEAKLIGVDKSTDLALLKIECENLNYIPFGNSDDSKVGEWVLAVGNPFNLTSTVTAGIISAKGRDINILENDPGTGLSAVESFIQTDAAVNPGNSGGALVNAKGELIGINTAIKSNTGSYTGYSFAVPVNIMRKVVDDLLEFGSVKRGFLGVTIRDINDELAKSEDLQSLEGVYISGLFEKGAAVKAGLQEGDVIQKIGDVSVKDVPALQEQISKYRPGDRIFVTVNRNKALKSLPITLTDKNGLAQVSPAQSAIDNDMLGAQFGNVPNDQKSKLGIQSGLKVEELRAGKLSGVGVREGFIITRIDKKEVNSRKDLEAALDNKKGGILIEGVYPNGRRAYYGFGM